MEIAEQNTISFVSINITKSGNRLETSVHRKSTNTGLLLHYHSRLDKRYRLWTNNTDCGQTIQTVDKRYKDYLFTTMILRSATSSALLSSTSTIQSIQRSTSFCIILTASLQPRIQETTALPSRSHYHLKISNQQSPSRGKCKF